MMKNLLIIALLISATVSFAQNDEAYVDRLVSEFTVNLSADWFSNKRYCLGENKMFFMNDGSRCISKETYFEVFVFWEKGDKTIMKKFDSCGEYESSTFDHEVFKYNYQSDIKNKGVKSYKVTNPENAPTSRTKIHSCYRTFVFKAGDEMFTNSYNLFDLSNVSKQENINFSYNNDLKIVDMDHIIDTLIPVYENSVERKK